MSHCIIRPIQLARFSDTQRVPPADMRELAGPFDNKECRFRPLASRECRCHPRTTLRFPAISRCCASLHFVPRVIAVRHIVGARLKWRHIERTLSLSRIRLSSSPPPGGFSNGLYTLPLFMVTRTYFTPAMLRQVLRRTSSQRSSNPPRNRIRTESTVMPTPLRNRAPIRAPLATPTAHPKWTCHAPNRFSQMRYPCTINNGPNRNVTNGAMNHMGNRYS